VFWVIGGAAAGKSTICRAIVERTSFQVYDMDAHIYDSYGPRYTPERHPANTRWLAAENPLAWMLGLDPAALDAFGRATTAEYLDLLAADLRDWPPEQPLLIDGGITHPALIAQALDARQIVCLTTSDEERVGAWETAEERAMMRGWVRALPEPERMWRRFLAQDAQIAATLERESQEAHIPVMVRQPSTSVRDLAEQVMVCLGIAPTVHPLG
jgi:hypothetical protein